MPYRYIRLYNYDSSCRTIWPCCYRRFRTSTPHSKRKQVYFSLHWLPQTVCHGMYHTWLYSSNDSQMFHEQNGFKTRRTKSVVIWPWIQLFIWTSQKNLWFMWDKKPNTTAYHPWTDRLCKWFNKTLANILATYVKDIITAMCSSKNSIKLYTFFTVGTQANTSMLTDATLMFALSRYAIDRDDYAAEIPRLFSTVWDLAKKNIYQIPWLPKRSLWQQSMLYHITLTV